MLDLIRARLRHGYQAIRDIRGAKVHERYRGFPLINESAITNQNDIISQCPAKAVSVYPFSIDIGKCVFCGDCVRTCGNKGISFSNFNHTASTSREHLIVRSGMTPESYETHAIESTKRIKSLFGRSLKMRSVSAGGCSACEMELNACSNANFDMGRFGIDMVASPRHADGVIITGPVSENMAAALNDTLSAIPSPRIVVAVGSCAISGGIFAESEAVDRSFFIKNKVDLYVPGCPAHPLTIINGILDFVGRK